MPAIETPAVPAGCNLSLPIINVDTRHGSNQISSETSGDVVNRAQDSIYRAWRRVGIPPQEAQHQAEQFARYFTERAPR